MEVLHRSDTRAGECPPWHLTGELLGGDLPELLGVHVEASLHDLAVLRVVLTEVEIPFLGQLLAFSLSEPPPQVRVRCGHVATNT